AGRDVVLLNSDTLVAPGWLERLRAAAHSAPDIGTVTPLSNDATICSYPSRERVNAVPDLAGVGRMARLAAAANGGEVVDIPTGHGFCLFLRRDCLADVGLLREDLFAQGYGEENEFCMRASRRGWRHVAATGAYVGHVGGASFGAAGAHLVRRNLVVLNRLHPGYDALVAAHVAADPLFAARRRMDVVRWKAGRVAAGTALLVTHEGGGGVERVVRERCEALRAQGLRAVVLRPVVLAEGALVEGGGACLVSEQAGSDAATPDAFPNLRFALPGELPALVRLLRGEGVVHAELHHLLGHHRAVLALLRRLGVPYDVFVHDYAWFCQRIALVGPGRRYCGEPDVAGCEACVADLGTNLEEEIAMPALLARSAEELAGARAVVAPSADAASRMRRHFPAVRAEVRAWEDEAGLPPMRVPRARPGGRLRVAVVGAIGLEKGFDVLLACARDARARALALEFVVVGPSIDDERLMRAGPVFVTGDYRDAEVDALIQAQDCDLGLLPSIWPETWCYTLTHMMRAGLGVAAFDLGGPAERIRRTGRGWLLPLGLPAASVNNALLGTARVAEHNRPSHSPAAGPAGLLPGPAGSLSGLSGR
ncbi:MAG: glycosyltransferase, partial [Janthinobacterium lividum]